MVCCGLMTRSAERPLILIVDDTEPVVRLIQLELSFQGFDSESDLLAHDPLAKAQELQPDAIILGALLGAGLVFGDARPALATKLIEVQIIRDGKVLLKSMYGVPDSDGPAEVWRKLVDVRLEATDEPVAHLR